MHVRIPWANHLTQSSSRERRDWDVFCQLVELVPGLKDRITKGDNNELLQISTLVRFFHYTIIFFVINTTQIQKGMSCARSDDTRGLKGAILDWIVPRGEVLNPPLYRNVKHDRGFHHERTGALLCPTEYDWNDEKCVVLPSFLPR